MTAYKEVRKWVVMDTINAFKGEEPPSEEEIEDTIYQTLETIFEDFRRDVNERLPDLLDEIEQRLRRGAGE